MKSRRLTKVPWLVAIAALMVAALIFVPRYADAQPQLPNRRPLDGGTKPTIVLVHGAWADGSSWG